MSGLLLAALAAGGGGQARGVTNNATNDFWELRPRIIQHLAEGKHDDGGSGWAHDFVWDATSEQLYRREHAGSGSNVEMMSTRQRCLSNEAELQSLVKRLACGSGSLGMLSTAPAIVEALAPLYWPVRIYLLNFSAACMAALESTSSFEDSAHVAVIGHNFGAGRTAYRAPAARTRRDLPLPGLA